MIFLKIKQGEELNHLLDLSIFAGWTISLLIWWHMGNTHLHLVPPGTAFALLTKRSTCTDRWTRRTETFTSHFVISERRCSVWMAISRVQRCHGVSKTTRNNWTCWIISCSQDISIHCTWKWQEHTVCFGETFSRSCSRLISERPVSTPVRTPERHLTDKQNTGRSCLLLKRRTKPTDLARTKTMTFQPRKLKLTYSLIASNEGNVSPWAQTEPSGTGTGGLRH